MASERKFVAENVRRVLLKEYLMKEVSRAGFGGLDVQRTPMGTRVILTTERPGLVIGRRGQTIKNLTAVIEDRFGFENPQIEVQEVENASLNAQIMAEKLAFSLRGTGPRSSKRVTSSSAERPRPTSLTTVTQSPSSRWESSESPSRSWPRTQ